MPSLTFNIITKADVKALEHVTRVVNELTDAVHSLGLTKLGAGGGTPGVRQLKSEETKAQAVRAKIMKEENRALELQLRKEALTHKVLKSTQKISEEEKIITAEKRKQRLETEREEKAEKRRADAAKRAADARKIREAPNIRAYEEALTEGLVAPGTVRPERYTPERLVRARMKRHAGATRVDEGATRIQEAVEKGWVTPGEAAAVDPARASRFWLARQQQKHLAQTGTSDMGMQGFAGGLLRGGIFGATQIFTTASMAGLGFGIAMATMKSIQLLFDTINEAIDKSIERARTFEQQWTALLGQVIQATGLHDDVDFAVKQAKQIAEAVGVIGSVFGIAAEDANTAVNVLLQTGMRIETVLQEWYKFANVAMLLTVGQAPSRQIPQEARALFGQGIAQQSAMMLAHATRGISEARGRPYTQPEVQALFQQAAMSDDPRAVGVLFTEAFGGFTRAIEERAKTLDAATSLLAEQFTRYNRTIMQERTEGLALFKTALAQTVQTWIEEVKQPGGVPRHNYIVAGAIERFFDIGVVEGAVSRRMAEAIDIMQAEGGLEAFATAQDKRRGNVLDQLAIGTMIGAEQFVGHLRNDLTRLLELPASLIPGTESAQRHKKAAEEIDQRYTARMARVSEGTLLADRPREEQVLALFREVLGNYGMLIGDDAIKHIADAAYKGIKEGATGASLELVDHINKMTLGIAQREPDPEIRRIRMARAHLAGLEMPSLLADIELRSRQIDRERQQAVSPHLDQTQRMRQLQDALYTTIADRQARISLIDSLGDSATVEELQDRAQAYEQLAQAIITLQEETLGIFREQLRLRQQEHQLNSDQIQIDSTRLEIQAAQNIGLQEQLQIEQKRQRLIQQQRNFLAPLITEAKKVKAATGLPEDISNYLRLQAEMAGLDLGVAQSGIAQMQLGARMTELQIARQGIGRDTARLFESLRDGFYFAGDRQQQPGTVARHAAERHAARFVQHQALLGQIGITSPTNLAATIGGSQVEQQVRTLQEELFDLDNANRILNETEQKRQDQIRQTITALQELTQSYIHAETTTRSYQQAQREFGFWQEDILMRLELENMRRAPKKEMERFYKGKLTDAEDRFQRTFGVPIDQITAETIPGVDQPEERREFERQLNHVLEMRKAYESLTGDFDQFVSTVDAGFQAMVVGMGTALLTADDMGEALRGIAHQFGQMLLQASLNFLFQQLFGNLLGSLLSAGAGAAGGAAGGGAAGGGPSVIDMPKKPTLDMGAMLPSRLGGGYGAEENLYDIVQKSNATHGWLNTAIVTATTPRDAF